MVAPNPHNAAEPSKVEVAKATSHSLRGGIADTLADPGAACFAEDDKQLLKFHGVYQQDDRETRHSGGGKSYSMMIRLCIPGGALTSEQYLALDELADKYANGTLRITTRQSIQYHGVLKSNLKATIAEIHRALLSTLAACGDVQRNVMASPAPFADEIHREVQRMAAKLAKELAPATGAYHEIWLDGEPVAANGEEEPFYGRQYLPRKFKTGIAIDTDNSIDIYAYDCGLVAITENGRIKGYNVVAGGGLGMTHNKADTFARIASVLGFVRPEHGIEAVRTVAAIFRDNGNRSDRRHARLKYLIEEWGLDRFVEEFHARVPWRLAPAAATPEPTQLDHIGVYDQGDGRWFFGVFVQNGRVLDNEQIRYRSAFRQIAREVRPGIRLTPMQSILFTDLALEQIEAIRGILAAHGVPDIGGISNLRRWSMACPALPTCGLALTDAERQLPDVLDELEKEFEVLGIDDSALTVRMTGCPNGCARPYNADIGFVGRKPGVYHIFVGGGLAGDRLADLFAADVPVEGFVETLRPLLRRFAAERRGSENLGPFYRRITGRHEPRVLLTGKETPTASLVTLTVSGAAPAAAEDNTNGNGTHANGRRNIMTALEHSSSASIAARQSPVHRRTYSNLADCVGQTRLVRLNRVIPAGGAEVLLKLEFDNPAASVKDRIGRAMIEDAETRGLIRPKGAKGADDPGTHIIEPTSGNTGIALAFIAAAKGYRLTLTMPETMSLERRALLKHLGANIVLTPGEKGMKGAIARANELLAETPDAWMPGQFDNPANPAVHEATTGPEIWADTGGKIDAIVSGVGTGGTITGVTRYIRAAGRNPDFKAIAVEPATSPVISGGQPGLHKVQGIGAGFVPKNLDTTLLSGVELVTNDEAFEWGRRLAREEGILGGISTGANVCVAARLAARPEYKGKRIVTIACSFGERYLSTLLFQPAT